MLKELYLQHTQGTICEKPYADVSLSLDTTLSNLSVTFKKLLVEHALVKHAEVTFGQIVDELSAKFVETFPNLDNIVRVPFISFCVYVLLFIHIPK